MEIKYYSDCSLPLPLFVLATAHHDMSALIIEGSAESDEERAELALLLDAAWGKINVEFMEVVGGTKAKVHADRVCRISHLAARLIAFQMAIESMRINPSVEIKEVLEAEFDITIDIEDPAQMEKSLERIITELKADEIEMEELTAIQKIEDEKQGAKAQPLTERQVIETLIEMGESSGTKYRISELTTLEYAILLNRYAKKNRR